MNEILCNVTKVKTSYQDRKILVLDVFVDLPDGGSLSVFNMVLDNYNESKKERQGTSYGCEILRQTLDFFGVDDLSEVKNYKCYLLSNKDSIWSAGDVLGLRQLPFQQYKHNLKEIIKEDVLNEFKQEK